MGGLETVDAAKAGWNADGAAAIGTEGDRTKACADGVGTAAGRPAAVVVGVMRVGGCPALWIVSRCILGNESVGWKTV